MSRELPDGVRPEVAFQLAELERSLSQAAAVLGGREARVFWSMIDRLEASRPQTEAKG